MDDKGDMRTRAIAQLNLAVKEDDGVGEAVQAAHMAGLEPYEIAELGGLPDRDVQPFIGGVLDHVETPAWLTPRTRAIVATSCSPEARIERASRQR